MRFFKPKVKPTFLTVLTIVFTAIMLSHGQAARAQDTTAPQVAFTNPAANAVLPSLPTLSGTVQDEAGGSGVSRVDVGILRDSDNQWWTGTGWTGSFTVQRATLSGNTWSLSTGLPTGSQLNDGPYTLIAQAYDVAGNTKQANDNITIKSDTTPPSITIASPTNNAVFRAFPAINGTVADDKSINRVVVGILRNSDNTWWDGNTWGKFATQPANFSNNAWTFTGSVPTGANLIDGIYTIIAQAFDQSGNFQQAQVSIRIDTTPPPTINISIPGNTPGSATILRSLSLVAGAAADTRDGSGISSVDLFIKRNSDGAYWGGSAWVQTPTALSTVFTGYNWSRSPGAGGSLPTGQDLQEGTYSLTATAHDKAGNSSTSAVTTVQVDKTAPAVLRFNSPINSAVLQKLPTISGTAVDNPGGTGISRVDLTIFRIGDNKFWTGTGWGAYTPLVTNFRGSTFTRSGGLPTGTNLTQGSYILTAIAYDKAGNSIQADNLVRVDTKAPRSVTVTSPAPNEVVRSLATIRGTAIDDTVGINNVVVTLRRNSDGLFWSGSSWGTIPARLTTVFDGFNWSRNSGLPSGDTLNDGSYTLSATAFDRAGNQAGTTSTFQVDKTVPTIVTITSPAYSAILPALPILRGAATDNPNGSGIAKVTVALLRTNDNKWWTGTTWGAFKELPTTLSGTTWVKSSGLPTGANLANGIYVLIAFAYDKAGNSIQVNNVFTISHTSAFGLSTATASAATESVQLGFTGALNPDVASDPSHFSVTVNGVAVTVQSAAYNASNKSVSLGLPTGALHTGDSVVVTWNNLLDANYGILTGQAGPLQVQ
ncbi:MAG: Ig-like domain repeat protein [Abitibacteriaceae bacterium]|nr:Ig-like domain repeat protein [Abditibacteriaceae bacterium]